MEGRQFPPKIQSFPTDKLKLTKHKGDLQPINTKRREIFHAGGEYSRIKHKLYLIKWRKGTRTVKYPSGFCFHSGKPTTLSQDVWSQREQEVI